MPMSFKRSRTESVRSVPLVNKLSFNPTAVAFLIMVNTSFLRRGSPPDMTSRYTWREAASSSTRWSASAVESSPGALSPPPELEQCTHWRLHCCVTSQIAARGNRGVKLKVFSFKGELLLKVEKRYLSRIVQEIFHVLYFLQVCSDLFHSPCLQI